MTSDKINQTTDETKNYIDVNGIPIYIKEFNGQRIVSFSDVDSVYKLSNGTIENCFYMRKKYFDRDIDYVVVDRNTLSKFNIKNKNSCRTFLTKKGLDKILSSCTKILFSCTTLIDKYKYFNDYFMPDPDYITKDNIEKYLTLLTNKIDDLKHFFCTEILGTLKNSCPNNIDTADPKIIEKDPNISSDWLDRTFEKLYLLHNYITVNQDKLSSCFLPKSSKITLSWIIHLVICQAEKMYNIKFSDYKIEYLDCTTVKTLSYIEYYSKTKETFEKTLNSLLACANITKDDVKYKLLIDDIKRIKAIKEK